MGYFNEVLVDAPYAWWRLHEAVGAASVLDHSGNGRHGTISATPPTFGKTDYTITPPFTSAQIGTTAMTVTAPWAHSAVADNWTVECWARPTATIGVVAEATNNTALTSITNRCLIPYTHGGPTASGAGISFGTNSIIAGGHGDNFAPCLARHDASRPATKLYHIVLRCNSRKFQLYVDGVLVRDGQTSPRVTYMAYRIGGTTFGSDAAFGGHVAEVAFYNKVLLQARIVAHYNAGLKNNIWVDKGARSPMVIG